MSPAFLSLLSFRCVAHLGLGSAHVHSLSFRKSYQSAIAYSIVVQADRQLLIAIAIDDTTGNAMKAAAGIIKSLNFLQAIEFRLIMATFAP